MKGFYILFLHIASITYTYSQEIKRDENARRSISTFKTTETIKLDGILDEDVWRSANKAQDFWMKFPNNTEKGSPATEAMVTYDNKFLYVAYKITVPKDKIINQSLKRDQGLRGGDGIGIVLDPLNLKTNGFYFAVSPYNSQTEGQIGATEEDIEFTWDNTWYSETKIYDDYWTAEIAIPFSVLRYENEGKVWGLNFVRAVRYKNEFHTWNNIPQQFPGTSLGYTGTLIWDDFPPQGGSKFVINPYVTGGFTSDKENNIETKPQGNIGMDAKIAVSSNMNLDLTINPDFSNVDVDVQVTNLTRFSVFFPERRAFFLENDDLFSSFGIPPVRPFYTRRIGSKNDQAVPILFGARLTGNLNKDLRIGAMNIQTGRKNGLSADNFTTLTFTQKVLERSQIKGYFINRSAFQTDQEKMTNPLDAYGRNAGLEANFSNKEGTINAWANGHQSFKPGSKGLNMFYNMGGGYFGQNFSSFIDHFAIDKDYYADVGFVNRVENYDAVRDTTIRRGTNSFYNETSYTFRPKKTFNTIELGSENFYALDDKNKTNELSFKLFTDFAFKNSSSVTLTYDINKVNLLYPFRFVDDETKKPLDAGLYDFKFFTIRASTDRRQNIILGGSAAFGKFYSADYQQYTASLTLRKQPYVSFAMMAEYNNLVFPTEYGSQTFLLLAPQIEVNFSNKLFWTNFMQYNTQTNNFNINSRLQYRYKPMSDFFLVYSDNYEIDPTIKNRNKGIVFKANYWLNI